ARGAACPPHIQDYWSPTPWRFGSNFGYQPQAPEQFRKSRSSRFFRRIALPTELPRREAHFTRNSECPTRPKWSNGLEDYLRSGAQWSPRVSTTTSRPLLTIGVSKRRHHCPSQTIAQSRTPDFQAQGMYVSRTRNTAAGTTRAASRRR